MTTISYELALALKNAGFVQTNNLARHPDGGQELVSFPTLSELIEAVRLTGKRFNLNFGRKWEAQAQGKTANGETEKVAVANLYIALHQTS